MKYAFLTIVFMIVSVILMMCFFSQYVGLSVLPEDALLLIFEKSFGGGIAATILTHIIGTERIAKKLGFK